MKTLQQLEEERGARNGRTRYKGTVSNEMFSMGAGSFTDEDIKRKVVTKKEYIKNKHKYILNATLGNSLFVTEL